MSYVHLIGIIVKFHNFCYAILLGCLGVVTLYIDFGKSTYQALVLKVVITPLVFNALLLLNQELMNPFDGTSKDVDFPMSCLNKGMEKDLAGYPLLARLTPKWFESAGLKYDPCSVQQRQHAQH